MSLSQRRILSTLPWVTIAALYLAISAWVTVRTTALDYAAYLIAAHGFVTGQDVYGWSAADFQAEARNLNIPYYAYPYRYSPVTALLIAPLLAFPYRAGLFIWSLINSAATIAAGELLSRLSSSPARRWLLRFSVWLFVPFIVSLYAGQVNPPATLLSVFAFLAFSRGRDRNAGGWTAAAFLAKPLSLGLVCYAVWKGKWTAVAVFAMVAAVTLLLLTALFGWGSLHSGVPLSIAGIHGGAYPPLQNLWGTAQRWLAPHEYGRAILAVPQSAGRLGLLLSLVLAAATMLLCLPPLRPASWRNAELGMVMTAIALIVPATWYHHYAILAIPLAVLIADGKSLMDFVFAGTAWLSINIFGVAWHSLVGHTVLLDLGTAGALVLWLGLAGISWRRRSRCAAGLHA